MLMKENFREQMRELEGEHTLDTIIKCPGLTAVPAFRGGGRSE